MPCFSVNRIGLAFKAENFDLLEAAIRDLGFAPNRVGDSVTFYGAYGQVTIARGEIRLDPRERQLVDKLNHSYCKQVIYQKAKKRGLKVRQVAPNRFEVARR